MGPWGERDGGNGAAVYPGTDMGKEMERGCCLLGPGYFGCTEVGAALGPSVWDNAVPQGHLLGEQGVTGW